jgi:hypothetical protein
MAFTYIVVPMNFPTFPHAFNVRSSMPRLFVEGGRVRPNEGVEIVSSLLGCEGAGPG